MEECPHCGELIDDRSESCPHCGSDAETGWRGDVDYYSVELPEEDDATEVRDRVATRPHSGRGTLTTVLLLLTVAGLLISGYPTYRSGVVVFAGFLLVCWLFFRSGTRYSD